MISSKKKVKTRGFGKKNIKVGGGGVWPYRGLSIEGEVKPSTHYDVSELGKVLSLFSFMSYGHNWVVKDVELFRYSR